MKTVASCLNLEGDDEMQILGVKLLPLFQEYSLKVFTFSDELYDSVTSKFLTEAEKILENSEKDDAMDLLKEGMEEVEF